MDTCTATVAVLKRTSQNLVVKQHRDDSHNTIRQLKDFITTQNKKSKVSSAFLTCSARSLCSESINSLISFPQVASGLSNQRVNTSWQQMTRPFNLCACSASMHLIVFPFSIKVHQKSDLLPLWSDGLHNFYFISFSSSQSHQLCHSGFEVYINRTQNLIYPRVNANTDSAYL